MHWRLVTDCRVHSCRAYAGCVSNNEMELLEVGGHNSVSLILSAAECILRRSKFLLWPKRCAFQIRKSPGSLEQPSRDAKTAAEPCRHGLELEHVAS